LPDEKDFAVESSIIRHRLSDDTVEVALSGEIDMENAHEIRDAVDAALTAGSPPLIRIDLHAVTLIDSMGISALVGAHHTAKVRGTHLVVVNPNEFVYRQLYISGLVGLLGRPRPRAGSD
jgi:anti-anti-sigma factor